MVDLIYQILGSSADPQIVTTVAGVVTIVVVAVVIDIVYRVFSHFWR